MKSLSLKDFPIGQFSGSLSMYGARKGMVHLNRECRHLQKSKEVITSETILASEGSLADLPDTHCSPINALGAYFNAASKMCEAFGKLQLISVDLCPDALSIQECKRNCWHEYHGDWRTRELILELFEAFNPEVPEEVEKAFPQAVRDLRDLVQGLQNGAQFYVKSDEGKLAFKRRMTALYILSGRTPRKYAPRYEWFRDAVACAMHPLCNEANPDKLNYLFDHGGFDLPKRWLEQVRERGAYQNLTSALLRESSEWHTPDPKLILLIVPVLNAVGQGFVDGSCLQLLDSVLVVAPDYFCPFPSYPKHEAWQQVPSVLLRKERQEERDTAVVAVVPKLWLKSTNGKLQDERLPLHLQLQTFIGGSECSSAYLQKQCEVMAHEIEQQCDVDVILNFRRESGKTLEVQREILEGIATSVLGGLVI